MKNIGAQLLANLGISAVSAIGKLPGVSASFGSSRGLVEDARFGVALRKALGSGSGTDAASALAALLQSGMPLSTIINQTSKALAGKLATAISTGAGHMIDAASKNQLVQAFASALSPPGSGPGVSSGTAPPGNAAQTAATLASTLQALLANMVGEKQSNAGQQLRFSGALLDANSAKEIPAQQIGDENTASSGSISSFVDQLLRDVIAQLQNQTGSNTGTISTLPVASQAQTQNRSTDPVARASDNSIPLPQTPSSNPSDLLGRMVARAITSDARINQNSTQSAAPVAANSAQNAQPQTPVSVQNALDNLVAAVTAAAKQMGSGSGGSGGGMDAFAWSAARSELAQLANNSAPSVSSSNSFAGQTNALLGILAATPQNNNVAAVPLAAVTPYTTVDPAAVMDQVVKGMVIRNLGQGNSEVRMRLSPANLGDVALKLNVSGSAVTATLTAQNGAVRDALVANQSQLSRSLADAGLKLTGFSVNVSGGGPQGFGAHTQLAQQAGIRRSAFSYARHDESDDPVLGAVPNIGPSILAGTKTGLFNYLV